jgi:hypothetical protein
MGELRLLQFATLPPQGLEVELVLGSSAAFELLLADSSPGLPDSGRGLASERGSLAVPIQDGDQSLVLRRVSVPRAPGN